MDMRQRGMLDNTRLLALPAQLLAMALPACLAFSGCPPTFPSLSPSQRLSSCARAHTYRARAVLTMSRKAQATDRVPLQKTEYSDSMLARFLQGFFEAQLLLAASGNPESSALRLGARTVTGNLGEGGDHDVLVFDRMIGAALEVARLPGGGAVARNRTLQLLYELFPAWFVPSIKGLFALFPLWFVARHASVFSVILTYWLVGKSEIQDVDPALLDSNTRVGWGNTPVGWVPGFALGKRWRPAVGVSQGVLVERCRVLETSGCASVCANVCKAPTQDFFTNGVGLPLTMVPDYETQSCTLIFGATPPPLEEDEAFTQGCLTTCVLANGDNSLQEAEVQRRLEAWRQATAPARSSSCPL